MDGRRMTIDRLARRVELRFEEPPSVALMEMLRAHRWRYSKAGQCWWTRDCLISRELAQGVVDGRIAEAR